MLKFLFNDDPSILGGAGTPPVDVPPTGTPPVDVPPSTGIWGDLSVKFPEGFEDGLKNEPSLKPFVNRETGEFNMANVLKSYIHTKKQFGENKITMPNENSPAEEWDALWAKIGWTNDESKYNIEKKEGYVLEDEFLSGFKKFAIENRLPVGMANKMAEYFNNTAKAGIEKSQTLRQEEIDTGINSLKTEWGNAYESKVSVAIRTLKEVVKDESVLEAFKDPSIGSNPAVIKVLAAIGGKLFKEDGINAGGEAALTPADISRKITDIMGDPNHAYHNKSHPSHAAAVQEVLKLYNLKGGK